MKETFKKVAGKASEVILTALVAGGIAFLQNILSQHGVQCGPQIDPASTAGIGAALSSLKVSYINRV